MGKLGAMMLGLLAWLPSGGLDGPPAPVPADFRVHVASFALKGEPVYTEEIIFREGRAYVFPSHTKEVVIFEPSRSRVVIVDIGRKVQTEVEFRTLDASVEKLKANFREAAETREKEGGRGNAIEAKMTRDLIEPKLSAAHDPKANRVRLTNPVVEVDADGEPESDAPRLALIRSTLSGIAKLGAYRAPTDLPPFVELDTIAALTGERRLRPTSLSYLYRLNGPPRKFRRTYGLATRLEDDEIKAVSRVDRFREGIPFLRYERYRTDR